MSSLNLVPSSFVEIAPSFTSVFALEPVDKTVIARGLNMYFDPKNNDLARQWVKENQQIIQKIDQIGQHHASICRGLSELDRQVKVATEKLGDVQKERSLLGSDTTNEFQSFEKQKDELRERLTEAQIKLAAESKLALFSINNPLGSRVARFAVKCGQYALPTSIPGLAWFQRNLLTANCGKVVSSALSLEPLKCASTVANPGVYVPLAVAGGVSALASYGTQMAKRILDEQDNLKSVQESLAILQQTHESAVQSLEVRNKELDDRIQGVRETLQTTTAQREELNKRQSELEKSMSAIRTDKYKQIFTANLKMLKLLLEQPSQREFEKLAGTTVMTTLLNTAVLAYTEQPSQFGAIAGSSTLAIEEAKE